MNTNDNSQKLFSGFTAVSAEDWKKQIIKDLKGEPYESLIWHNENGFDIEPFYNKESLKHEYEPAFAEGDWEICVKNKHTEAQLINRQLLNALNNGASSISIDLRGVDPELALQDISMENIYSVFKTDTEGFEKLHAYLYEKHDLEKLKSIIFQEKVTGITDLEEWRTPVSIFKPYASVSTICVDVLPFHNLNCTASYETAIAFSALIEQLEFFTARQLPLSPFVIKVGVSSDYFVQLAKFRAIRRLWYLFKNEYELNNELLIIAETGLTNKTISDPYNNLLRSTVEAMAAIGGGSNFLIVNEFDNLYSNYSEDSERLSVNQQLILKKESFLSAMADVGCGSYYIENLTDKIAEAALIHFKNFEKVGGYFKCLQTSIFTNDIQKQALMKDNDFKNGTQFSIGINKFKSEKSQLLLSPDQQIYIKQLPVNNPALNFELNNFISKEDA